MDATPNDLQSVKALADENALLREELRALRDQLLKRQAAENGVLSPSAFGMYPVPDPQILAQANQLQAMYTQALANQAYALPNKQLWDTNPTHQLSAHPIGLGDNNGSQKGQLRPASNAAEAETRLEKKIDKAWDELGVTKAKVTSLETAIADEKAGSGKELDERIAQLESEIKELKASAGGLAPRNSLEFSGNFHWLHQLEFINRAIQKKPGDFNCGKECHLDCSKPAASHRTVQKTTCFNCGVEGHLSVNCPESNQVGPDEIGYDDYHIWE